MGSLPASEVESVCPPSVVVCVVVVGVGGVGGGKVGGERVLLHCTSKW